MTSVCDALLLIANIQRNNHVALPFDILYQIFFEWLDTYFRVTHKNIYNPVEAGRNANQLYLELPIDLNQSEFIPYSVIYEVKSKDQGWSSSNTRHKGTRYESYTWGEACLSISPHERFEVYRNIHAGRDWEVQQKVFDENHPMVIFMRDMLPSTNTQTADDTTEGKNEESSKKLLEDHVAYIRSHAVTLQLYVRSLYPGWVNNINYARIELHSRPSLQVIRDAVVRIDQMSHIVNSSTRSASPTKCIIM